MISVNEAPTTVVGEAERVKNYTEPGTAATAAKGISGEASMPMQPDIASSLEHMEEDPARVCFPPQVSTARTRLRGSLKELTLKYSRNRTKIGERRRTPPLGSLTSCS